MIKRKVKSGHVLKKVNGRYVDTTGVDPREHLDNIIMIMNSRKLGKPVNFCEKSKEIHKKYEMERVARSLLNSAALKDDPEIEALRMELFPLERNSKESLYSPCPEGKIYDTLPEEGEYNPFELPQELRAASTSNVSNNNSLEG
jgi:hypothetical protein